MYARLFDCRYFSMSLGILRWGFSIRVRVCVHYSDDIRLAFVLRHGRDEDDLPLGKDLVLLMEAVDIGSNYIREFDKPCE